MIASLSCSFIPKYYQKRQNQAYIFIFSHCLAYYMANNLLKRHLTFSENISFKVQQDYFKGQGKIYAKCYRKI